MRGGGGAALCRGGGVPPCAGGLVPDTLCPEAEKMRTGANRLDFTVNANISNKFCSSGSQEMPKVMQIP